LIRIRLQKKGRKKRPIFHIVVADSKVARDGRIIEQVGRYDNVTEKKEVVLNEDRILYWLDTGAQPSDTVRKILRNEGVLYKRHLMMWGKNEEEIEAALAEWKSYRDSKEDGNDSRKDKYKNILAAEEKEFKDQVQKKAAKAAVELESESSDEETATEETEATAETEATEEVATEETTDEAPAEEEVVEEAAPEAEAKEAAEEVEEKVAEATEEPATEEAVVEETPAEETKDEAPAEEEKEEAAEEAKAEASSTETSSAMTAKDAIDHINNTDMDALKGFISDDESRKTVLAAWESKQSEG
jgi:small subunit ribosomal protein S16|tara:strand:- start:10098 stop:11000 length:903 start_codon:yes stop_codon:yes gene_type:complete